MKTTITSRQRRRLRAGIRTEIRRCQRCLQLIDFVDAEVCGAGVRLFANEGTFALWLCEPAVSFGGEVPLRLMRTAKGRRKIVNLLRAVAHGVYL